MPYKYAIFTCYPDKLSKTDAQKRSRLNSYAQMHENKVHKVVVDCFFLLHDKSHISLSIWPQVLVLAVVNLKLPI